MALLFDVPPEIRSIVYSCMDPTALGVLSTCSTQLWDELSFGDCWALHNSTMWSTSSRTPNTDNSRSFFSCMMSAFGRYKNDYASIHSAWSVFEDAHAARTSARRRDLRFRLIAGISEKQVQEVEDRFRSAVADPSYELPSDLRLSLLVKAGESPFFQPAVDDHFNDAPAPGIPLITDLFHELLPANHFIQVGFLCGGGLLFLKLPENDYYVWYHPDRSFIVEGCQMPRIMWRLNRWRWADVLQWQAAHLRPRGSGWDTCIRGSDTVSGPNQSLRILVDTKTYFCVRIGARQKLTFTYRVRIESLARDMQTVMLKSRYWNIRHGDGQIEEVHGPGVVGETPTLGPGEFFEYCSFCPTECPPIVMQGHFLFVDLQTGATIRGDIDPFTMELPGHP